MDVQKKRHLFLMVASLILALPFDKSLYNLLLPISNSTFGTLWAHFADLAGNGLVQIIFFVVIAASYRLLTQKGFWEITISCSLAIALSGLISQILKIIIGRPRPGMLMPSWELSFFSTASDFHSFPSGHAAASFSIAFCLVHFMPRLKYLWIGLATAVSLGRVIGQAHFLSDIIAGAIVGLISSTLSLAHKNFLFKIISRSNLNRIFSITSFRLWKRLLHFARND